MFISLAALVLATSASVEPSVEERDFETYLWFSKQFYDSSTRQRVSFGDKQVILFTCWHGLDEQEYEYVAKIYDSSGRQVLSHPVNFIPESGEERWDVWTPYVFDPAIDVPGRWRFEVYLDGELVGWQPLEVEGSADVSASTVEEASFTWIPLYQPPPAVPEPAISTRTAGEVIANVYVDAKGVVRSSHIVHSFPKGLYDAAVTEILTKWRYAPGGTDVEVAPARFSVSFRFDGEAVVVEDSMEPVALRQVRIRKIRGRNGSVAVADLLRYGFKRDQIVNLTTFSKFDSKESSQSACSEIEPLGDESWVYENDDGTAGCGLRRNVRANDRAINSFLKSVDATVNAHEGKRRPLWVQVE